MKNRIILLSIFILTAFVAVTSCSRLDLAVSLANSYVTNKTDDYFDLTKEQKKWLKATLERDIDKVKKSIFPQLASEMFKAAALLSDDKKVLDSNTVYNTYKRVENLFYEGIRVFTPTAAMLSDKLTPNQIAHFQEEFDKKIKDVKEDSQDKSYDKMKKHFDSWMGSLSSKQKKELKDFVAKNPTPITETVYSRQTLAYEFVRLDKEKRKAFVEKLFNSYESMKEPAYAKLTESHSRKVISFVTNTLNKMSADQRKTLVETIRDRANQLIKISKG